MTSIALQLAHSVEASRVYISKALAERSDIVNHSLRDQWHHLVLGPLSKLSDNDCPASLVLVVDALDECDSDGNIRIIVQLLAEARSLTRARLRVLLTSRPEVPIRHGFYQMPDADVVLHNISRPIVDRDPFHRCSFHQKYVKYSCFMVSLPIVVEPWVVKVG
jgi:hypothetical protein